MERDELIHSRRWIILGIMSLSLIIVMLNNVTLNVALPELSKDLQADNTELQWMLDAYALIFGGTLLVMGAIGDRFGRKGALQLGLIMVAGASALTAMYASTSNEVIAARAVMGLGAALVMPATLSVVVVVFPPEERGKAVGIWAAMAGVGAPIGLLVGGWAVENYDWQMVFLINVPIIALALLLGLFLVPKTKDDQERPLDPVGALLSVAALGSILYAIIEGPSVGWGSSEILGIGALGIVFSAIFIRWERRTEYPMLPLDFFKDRGFTMGLVAIMLAFYVMFSFMFTQMLHFQLVRGLTPLGAAFKFLWLPVGLMPAAANSDRLVEKFGSNNVIATGLTLVTIGMLIFTTVTIDTDYSKLALIFFLVGLGMGLTMAPSTTLVMDSIPAGKAGVGSATNDTSREVGGALGIAIGGSVLNEYYQRSMIVPEGLEHLGQLPFDSFAAAIRIGSDMSAGGNILGAQLIENAQLAFVEGMVASAFVGAVIAFIGAILVKLFMPSRIIHHAEE
ncbi:MAG: MFS transporter [Euryarchaeota archaeon]|nr:MFS transporter [Euryarchaeota archaeon]MBT3654208.1 MFS transporter [Euryarchaeota archaeon]MBT3757124.1 MFS transporter [Euryarchaeota archaeon]MBT4050292.1 MFS transporter [Euryarchaeota archaeon]MBT4346284.1 MFS transporter [Euryarchaeota archaeon]